MPVGVMLRTMTSSEITEWMAYFMLKSEKSEPEQKIDPKAYLESIFKSRLVKKQK